jgi:hypothetical protein
MAQTQYDYTVTSAFPNQAVTLLRLKKEIEASAIATALDHLSWDEDGDTCSVFMADALSAPDKTTLDAVVAAHQGAAYSPAGSAEAQIVGTVETTASSYVAVAGMSATPSFGKYTVHFSSSIEADKNNSEVFVALRYDGQVLAGSERSMRRGQGLTRHFAKIQHTFEATKDDALLEVVWYATGGASATMSDRSLLVNRRRA